MMRMVWWREPAWQAGLRPMSGMGRPPFLQRGYSTFTKITYFFAKILEKVQKHFLIEDIFHFSFFNIRMIFFLYQGRVKKSHIF